ncbi:MAG: hypothetical protein ABJ360_28460 [Roseobacter sp.]
MPRWVWFVPLGGITLMLALWAFRLGWIVATTSETDVIETYAHQYLRDRARDGIADGAALTDCVALPGDFPGVWLHIVCDPTPTDPSRSYEYEVNRFGQFVRGWSPQSEGLKPGSGPRLPET